MQRTFKIVSWAITATVYEVNWRQYTKEGTLKALAVHLPRLKKMGVGILWMMPITPISKEKRQGTLGSYYACSSYTEINPELGTMDDFVDFVKKVHALDMKIIIDFVANHTGWDHEWTKTNSEWYKKDEQNVFYEANGWQDVIDLDYTNQALRNAVTNAMLFWVQHADIDGFRCDMAHLVPLDFWRESRIKLDKVKPLFWLAETDDFLYYEVFDVSYAWQWMHALDKAIQKSECWKEVKDIMLYYTTLDLSVRKLFFLSNHDENSWNGTEFEKYGSCVSPLTVLCFTWLTMPLIYSGQEYAQKKRLAFFEKDYIEKEEDKNISSFYQRLSQLHATDLFALGAVEWIPTLHEYIFCFLRKYKDELAFVCINMSSNDKIKIHVTHELLKGNFKSFTSNLLFYFNGVEQFELLPYQYIIYTKVL